MSKLNKDQKEEYLSSNFHQYLIITLNNDDEMPENSFVNVAITLEDLDWDTKDELNRSGLGRFSEYVNTETFANFLFTPEDDFQTIFDYEYYQEVFFIRLKPYTNKIAMHILPQKYEGFIENDVLLFRDSPIEPNMHQYYKNHESPNVNLYYQYQLDSADAGDRPLSLDPPKFSKFSDKHTYYNYNNGHWQQDPYQDTYGEFDFDISPLTINIDSIQINAGYKYNESTSDKNIVHYTGIYDNKAVGSQKAVLIDANYDGESSYTNVITQLTWNNDTNELKFPQDSADAYQDLGFDNTHIGNIGKLFHKTIKYWNDTIFISERKDSRNEEDDYKIGHWVDPDEVD